MLRRNLHKRERQKLHLSAMQSRAIRLLMSARTRNVAYLAAFAIVVMAACGAIVGGASYQRDHFAAISLEGDPAWYRDFGGRSVPEIQDLDIFYSNIGESVRNARGADIVILGPSFVLYAIDDDLLRQFGERHGVKIYNMAFLGIRGGEFSRELIERWRIRPKLWIINADDQFVHFFSASLDLFLGPHQERIAAVGRSRLDGWRAVSGRNLRWRIEDAKAAPSEFWAGLSPAPLGIYRRVDNGSLYLLGNPTYVADTNPIIRVDRDQDCHTNAETVALARDYLTAIGGRAMLMLVPHSQYCPQQARELAQALGVEAVIPPTASYTTVDGGGHLDRKGAAAFTAFLLNSIEKTPAFKAIARQ